MYAKHVACAAILALTAATVSAAQEIEIVHARRPLACVVLAPDASALEKEAAGDLQWAIQRAAAVKIEVLAAAAVPRGLVPIRIGGAALEKGAQDKSTAPPELKELPYDGAIVRATPEGIDIVGPTPAGTANGVATVLLEDLGVRTYYPDPLFTVVPRSSTITIRSRVVRPSFDYRVWSGVVGEDAAAYRRRNRLTDTRIPVLYFGFGHNLANIISVSKYGKEHPEYFAFRDGARRPEGKDVGDATQPCFTNPDVVRLTIEAAKEFFTQHPDSNTFSLCVNDNPRYCECEKCADMDKPYRDLPVGRQYSESYYDYVSKVAEAIATSHPGKYLGVYAYWNVEQPPRNRKRLPDDVIPALTLDILQHYDPAYRDKDRALIETWSGCVKRLHTYVYYGLGWYTPRMSPKLAAEDLRFAAEHGVRAIYCEVYPFWAWCGPMDYVAARLQWDVKADVDRILDEFHRDLFGDAAAEVRAYHEACERYWTRARPGRWFEGLDRLGPEEAMADLSILHEARRQLEAAATKAHDRDGKKRIAWLKKGFDFTMAVAGAFEAKKADGTSQQKLERLIAAARAVEAAQAELVKDPGYKHTYYEPGDRFGGKCWGWFKGAIAPAAEACWKDLRAASPEAEAKTKWETLKKDTGLNKLLQTSDWTLPFGSKQP